MSDSGATGGDPPTVDAMAHQTVTNDAVAGKPVYNTNHASLAETLDAEATEEQHLDDRHATGEHYVSEKHQEIPVDDDPLVDVYRDDLPEAAIEDPELNAGRGVDNI